MTPGVFVPGDRISDLIAGGPGFIAVGSHFGADERNDAVVWTSPDGREWTRVPHDEALFETGSARMHHILRFGNGYVAVGGSCDDPEAPCPEHPRIWMSPDGLSWVRAPWDPEVLAPHVLLFDVVVTTDGERLLAIGSVCLVDGIELDAQAWSDFAFGRTEGELECPFAAWVSPEAVTWERVYLDADRLAFANTVAVTTDGYVAVGGVWDLSIDDNRPAAWTSTDGISWTRAEVPTNRAGGISRIVATDNGFVGAGWLRSRDRNAHFQMAAWTSADGSSWTLVHDEGRDSDVLAMTIGGPGIIVAGADTDTDPAIAHVAVWTSADGISWQRITGPVSGLPDGFAHRILAVGDEVLMVANDPNGELVGIWVAPPP